MSYRFHSHFLNGGLCINSKISQNFNIIGKSWVLERNDMFGETANDAFCKLQCLERPDCEHTSSLNIW